MIKNIELYFEHGALQQIDVTFKGNILKSKIRKIFNLPVKRSNYPENVIDITYGENVLSNEKSENYTKWLGITGFTHMGAGDYDSE